ncbi:MAG TPA: hypothetical protein DIC56_17680 [Rhizobium sp.]|nr:hypothetical protein [Rhizobium sp.]
MNLNDINFGDVDAKNEILKQARLGERVFFESFSVPSGVDVSEILSGRRYYILGLKGTGKTALLRFINDKIQNAGSNSELVLFKSQVTEEDRQNLSKSSGFEIVVTGDVPVFIQDFKEAWKWMIYQRLSALVKESKIDSIEARQLYSLTGIAEKGVVHSLGSLFSKIKSTNIRLSGEALGIAVELGLDASNEKDQSTVSMSELNRTCGRLFRAFDIEKPIYLLFDELELFHQTPEQFDRDRRIIRDLIYAISQVNAEFAENGKNIFLISSLRTEVLHSVLELGHEIGRDVDDFGVRLDWSSGKDSPTHPLLRLISKKISVSSRVPENDVWGTFFPNNINNQQFFKFILNSSYYRPRDIVRLLRVARDFRPDAETFTTEHFDKTSTEYSKQTWLEVTEELLASYSTQEISALQRFFLGFNTHFFKQDLTSRIQRMYKKDKDVQSLFSKSDLTKVLSDLFRIGVIGNDFVVINSMGKKTPRNRWIFRGNTVLNDAERMCIHKSLWKHLSLVPGTAKS